MAGTSTEQFGRGYLAAGNGELVHVQNFKISVVNNGKIVHTISRSPAGTTRGNIECTVTYQSAWGTEGQDLDSLKKILTAEATQLRGKFDGVTVVCEGIFTSNDIDAPLDAENTESLTFIGSVTVT